MLGGNLGSFEAAPFIVVGLSMAECGTLAATCGVTHMRRTSATRLFVS